MSWRQINFGAHAFDGNKSRPSAKESDVETGDLETGDATSSSAKESGLHGMGTERSWGAGACLSYAVGSATPLLDVCLERLIGPHRISAHVRKREGVPGVAWRGWVG